MTVEIADEVAQNFNRMLDRLAAIVRAERDFARDAAHELRVPLTVCWGNLGLLAEGLLDDDPADRDRRIAVTVEEIGRMMRIVDGLRLLAESAHTDFLRTEQIELDAFVNDVAGRADALGRRRWRVEATAGEVIADRQRLIAAVMNLVDNAVHHTADGDEIAIGTRATGPEVRIWVRDGGRGIPAADQDLIFDRLRRGTGAAEHYRGSGLGLAIVRAIAEAHGGRVELRSRVGRGSTFTVVLPRYPAGEQRGWPES